jgi:aryl-alcohol dehydrogenase-like predicted oxidoreductase
MYSRYDQTNIMKATKRYVNLAHQQGITPAQLALAYVRTRWFVTSTIVGATKIAQLQENLHSINIELDETILTDIDQIHRSYPNPTA